MEISHLFFLFLIVAVIGIIAAFINIATAATRMVNDGDIKNVLVVHVIAGLFYVLGGLGAIITGIIWALHYLKHG